MRRSPYLTVFIALLSLAVSSGCDGIGRRLVDRAPPGGGLPPDVCVDPPECDEPPDVMEHPLKAARQVAMAGCGETPPQGGDQTVRCTPLRWPEDEVGVIRQTGFTLRHRNWVIESEKPLDVYLEGAVLDDVWLALRGPVSVHLSSRSILTDVRVEMMAFVEGGVEPVITMDESDGTDLVFASPAVPVGDLTVKHSRLKGAQLAAATVMVESVVSTQLTVEATRFTAIDLYADEAQFGFDSAVIASSMLSLVRVTRCGEATMVNTIVNQYVMAACTQGSFHAYRASIGGGAIDGAVDSDGSSFSNVLFGADSKTDLHAWLTAFSDVNFCKRSTVTFGESTSVDCSRCDGGRRDLFACTLPGEFVTLSENDCPVLQAGELCLPPLPVRPRPQEAL